MIYRTYSKYEIIASVVIFLTIAILKFWMEHPVATTVIACIVIVLSLLGNKYLINRDYKYSIKSVRKSLVAGHNTIANAHCTAKFFPDDKLIVMENIADSDNKKRMFTLSVKDKFKVNKCWSDVCRVFDDYSNIRSLALLLDVPPKYIITLESTVKQPPKVQAPKQINIDNSKSGPKVDIGKNSTMPYTIGPGKNITDSSQFAQREIEAPEFVETKNITSAAKKLNVNTATAEELSTLPGINLIIAKKIVEFRDKQGYFTSEEDFLKQANVKEHFVEKIKSMIIVKKPEQTKPNDNNEDQGRIVDL